MYFYTNLDCSAMESVTKRSKTHALASLGRLKRVSTGTVQEILTGTEKILGFWMGGTMQPLSAEPRFETLLSLIFNVSVIWFSYMYLAHKMFDLHFVNWATTMPRYEETLDRPSNLNASTTQGWQHLPLENS